MTDLGFIHRFIPATQPDSPPLLLLHGTGGDENDLVPLGERLSPGAALLSPRGKVLENGMPRFFRRLAEACSTRPTLKLRTSELADFISAARKEYGIDAPVRGRVFQRRQYRGLAVADAAGRIARRRTDARHAAVRTAIPACSFRQTGTAALRLQRSDDLGRRARPAG